MIILYNLTVCAHNKYTEDAMNDKFLCGLVLGMLGGAVLVANCKKARQMVREGSQQVMQKVEELNKNKQKQERVE